MNLLTETIPTAFCPETAFAVALHTSGKQHERSNEAQRMSRLISLSEDELMHRGIPDSALHD